MGYTASIDIVIEGKLDETFFKSHLFLSGWGFNDNEFIYYIKLNEDDFEWTKVPSSEKENVLFEITQKLLLNEDVGIIIIYKDTNIGGQLLYFPKNRQISLNVNVNRQTLKSGETDFEWYKKKYVQMFETFKIKSVNYYE